MNNLKETYDRLLNGNKQWQLKKITEDPMYFDELSKGQTPDYLWIGCADSRVPDNEITGSSPGDIFVHRNIANMVVHTDMNLLSVLQYAVEVLHVKHVIVCGHYGCGGVLAAMKNTENGLVDNWLRNIKEVYYTHRVELEAIEDMKLRGDRLVELNVRHQVENLAKTATVQNAWKKRELQVHGWVFNLTTGGIIDLEVMKDELEDMPSIFHYS
ncbi:MAG: carbonic anhydrase [Bacteroidetes bacterium B1(2017)]|nr:MAG: carbonic anhydrase [Bacteroidetes bacterium B1(2017)]